MDGRRHEDGSLREWSRVVGLHDEMDTRVDRTTACAIISRVSKEPNHGMVATKNLSIWYLHCTVAVVDVQKYFSTCGVREPLGTYQEREWPEV
jgi:hypothetical protein